MGTLSVLQQFEAHNVTHLYYIFPLVSAGSIEAHGILSKNAVQRGRLLTSSFALEEAQSIRNKRQAVLPDKTEVGLHELVPLYFNPCNPTLWRLKGEHKWPELGIAVIPVSLLCISIDHWFASDGNVASGQKTQLFSGDNALSHLDWPLLRALNWNHSDPSVKAENKRRRCAEFLVGPRVPASCIGEIVVHTEMARISTRVSVPVRVWPRLFTHGTLWT
ncbi:MAG: DUF4433 domain-containing protein [Phycisphaerae bacterium]